MMLKKAVHFTICVAVLMFFASVTGCARPSSLSELDDDVLSSEKGFESVVFWRVRVIDKTGTITSRPRFAIYRPRHTKEGATDFDERIFDSLTVEGDWSKQEGLPTFETMVFAASKADEYLFQDVSFFLYTDYPPNYWSGGRSIEKDVFFTVPLNRLCTIPRGRLVYLGEISIEFLKEERAGYSYRVHFVQDTADFHDAVKQFRESYPGLFKRFNRTVDTGSWKVLLIEHFAANDNGWTIPTGDKRVSADFKKGKYILQSSDEGCHWAGITPSFEKPGDFDIELAGMANMKDDTQGYGLALGNDRDNAYNFLVSGSGQAKAELYKNGEPQPEHTPWKDGADGKTPETTVNRLKLEVRADILKYYVNGRYIGEIKNELDMKDWFIGLAVCGRQTVSFDQLTLTER